MGVKIWLIIMLFNPNGMPAITQIFIGSGYQAEKLCETAKAKIIENAAGLPITVTCIMGST